ncbi:HipA domain-containing protein [Nocardia sp. NPDC056064]|uniref:HipA domain-containing protein n=1 Tax=Nocardia sp. NPDC056064 TaxID=3345701 RepID=UPI0035DEE960
MQYIRTYRDAELNAAVQMRAMGFDDAALTGDGADGGIDVSSGRALAQVKWRGAAVSRDELQKLFGARGSLLEKRLLFFAASEFSKPAVAYADEHSDEHGIALFVYEPHGALIARSLAATQLSSGVRDSVPWAAPTATARHDGRSHAPHSDRVQSADVYKAGVLAGSLDRQSDGRIEFHYAASYLDLEGEPVASTLPIGGRSVCGPVGTAPSFFSGLLPEGERLTALRGLLKNGDELALLLAVGAETPGDVQLFPSGTDHVDDVPALVDGRSLGDLDFDRLAAETDRHSLPGVQDKTSAMLSGSSRHAAGGRFILKLSKASYPNLIENEAAHLAAARMLKLGVVDSNLVHDGSGQSGLLIRRFDRVHDGGRWRRLAFEDATQVLGLPPSAKYNVDSVAVVQALARIADAPLIAARNLYLQFLFAWLTGNGDLHGKNVGVLRDGVGRWGIAPMYDIPCTLIYGDDSMAVPIVGRTRGLRASHWSEFAAEVGLPAKAAVSAQKLALRAASVVDTMALPFSGSPLNRTLRELRLRRGELENSFGSH